jgi:hypothetical protein
MIRDPQYVGRVTSTILGTGMPKRMRDEQFVKVKLEKADILSTKCKSCCKNYYLQKLKTHSIREAGEKYFRLKYTDRPLSLQWLIGKGEIQNDKEITNERVLSQARRNAKNTRPKWMSNKPPYLSNVFFFAEIIKNWKN